MILWVKDDLRRYIAKIYYSLQRGLRLETDLISWGVSEDFFDYKVVNYQQILKKCNCNPDLIISDYRYHKGKYRYTGLSKVPCKRAFILGDYWNTKDLAHGIREGGITDIFIFFKDALDRYPELRDKVHWLQPSIDPEIFKDWKQEKRYLVGFLGAGCDKDKKPYRDRYRITQKLKGTYGRSFYTQDHPGWGYFNEGSSIVGKGFSQAINKCKMFVTSAGSIGHCNPKYYEIAASNSLLICTQASYMEECGFVDGETCVLVTEDNIIDRINYYERHEQEAQNIIARAQAMITERHTGQVRAKELMRCVF